MDIKTLSVPETSNSLNLVWNTKRLFLPYDCSWDLKSLHKLSWCPKLYNRVPFLGR